MYRIKPRANLELPTHIATLGLEITDEPIDPVCGGATGRDVHFENGDMSIIVYTNERNAAFKISNGNEITVDPTSIETAEEIGLNLLGPLLRLVLLQRGEFVLHGSVVQLGERTVVFIAPSGGGKSTIAAGLYNRGHGVLADDTGIVQLGEYPSVLAGPPVLKLHEKDATRIDRSAKPIFSHGLESGKRFYQLMENDDTPERTSLDAVYLIERGDTIELEPVSARDATVEFIDNSWGLPVEDQEAAAENFRRCSELAQSVIVRRIQYPRSFESFDDVLNRIEDDCTDV